MISLPAVSRTMASTGLVLALVLSPALAQVAAVDSFTIGQRVPSNLGAQGYACSPSDDFAGLIRCQRTRNRGPGGTQSELSSVLHDTEGTAQYAMNLVAPAQLTKDQIEAEIADLARKFGSNPSSSEMLPDRADSKMAIVAIWGDLRIEELGYHGRDEIRAGRSAKEGVLIDLVGNFVRSIKEDLPIYRVLGGKGTLYLADFGAGTRGHRRIVGIDATSIMVRKFEADMQALLQQDRQLPKDDLSLWPKIAEKGRRLALDTSLATADQALERTFQRSGEKYRSTLWARLPGSVIEGLGVHSYRPGVDHYGPATKYPEIRSELQSWIAAHPADRFVEIAHYALGELDKGIEKRPASPIKDVLHYGIAHRELRQLVREMIDVARQRSAEVPAGFTDSSHRIRYLHRNPKIFENKAIGSFVKTFAGRAAEATPHLQAVLATPQSMVADDAAYFLGFLAFHRGDMNAALSSFELAMTLGNRDYEYPAVIQALRALMTMPSEEQMRRVEASKTFIKRTRLGYVAARSAYREFKYGDVTEFVGRILTDLKVPAGSLPATTDPKRLEPALRRFAPQFTDDYEASTHIVEMLYLAEAASEMQQYVKYISAISSQPPEVAIKRAREIIIKYSFITEPAAEKSPKRKAPELLQHRDLRQALHLVEVTLAATPRTPAYSAFREWLHYRKIRILNAHTYKEDKERSRAREVEAAVRELQLETPDSKLLDDAYAELIVAQGLRLHDVTAAQRSFEEVLKRFPEGNAIDNAHGWLAVSLYCSGRVQDAQAADREIVRRFPQTRHASYAKARLAAHDYDWGDSELCDHARPEFGADSDRDDVENTPCEFITRREEHDCR